MIAEPPCGAAVHIWKRTRHRGYLLCTGRIKRVYYGVGHTAFFIYRVKHFYKRSSAYRVSDTVHSAVRSERLEKSTVRVAVNRKMQLHYKSAALIKTG